MRHYIDSSNRIWGFDNTQTSLIPTDAVEIPSTYTAEQYAYLKLINRVVSFDALAYNNNLWEQIRAKRNQLLRETDWVGLKDVTSPNEQEWFSYRQALRDITETFSSPESVIWPTKPE